MAQVKRNWDVIGSTIHHQMRGIIIDANLVQKILDADFEQGVEDFEQGVEVPGLRSPAKPL